MGCGCKNNGIVQQPQAQPQGQPINRTQNQTQTIQQSIKNHGRFWSFSLL